MSKVEHPLSSRIVSFYTFIVNVDGEEKIALHPIDGVPLIYLKKEGLEKDNIKKMVQSMADHHKLYFELREYKIVDESAETFYPKATEYNA
jgi:hypothetical protein